MWIVFIGIKLVSRVNETEKKNCASDVNLNVCEFILLSMKKKNLIQIAWFFSILFFCTGNSGTSVKLKSIPTDRHMRMLIAHEKVSRTSNFPFRSHMHRAHHSTHHLAFVRAHAHFMHSQYIYISEPYR